MKRITVAIILVMIAVMLLTFKAIAVTPDLNGTILDEKGEPMPFVNVVLLSLPDSAYVQGAMTDEQGRFLISTPQGTGVLKVSSIGYETLYVAPSALGQPIQMREATLLLGEVVIKSQLPKTFVKGEDHRRRHTAGEGRHRDRCAEESAVA